MGDAELGHLMDAADVHCLFCLEELGRLIRIERWEERDGVRPACAWLQPEAA
jgi:hypothetical protein